MFRRSLIFLATTIVALIAIFFTGRTPTHAPHSTPSKWLGRNNTVLFLSNSEYGLGNVVLATSHAMLVEHPDIEVHCASFKKFSRDIETISRFALKQTSDPKKARPINFHIFKGFLYAETIVSRGFSQQYFIHKPGLSGTASLCDIMQTALMPWTAQEYLGLYEEVLSVLDEVNPVVVVVEPLFGLGLDAIRAQGRNHVILSPNALKDSFAAMQPWGAILWKYPA